jgi:hypothetical protein
LWLAIFQISVNQTSPPIEVPDYYSVRVVRDAPNADYYLSVKDPHRSDIEVWVVPLFHGQEQFPTDEQTGLLKPFPIFGGELLTSKPEGIGMRTTGGLLTIGTTTIARHPLHVIKNNPN